MPLLAAHRSSVGLVSTQNGKKICRCTLHARLLVVYGPSPLVLSLCWHAQSGRTGIASAEMRAGAASLGFAKPGACVPNLAKPKLVLEGRGCGEIGRCQGCAEVCEGPSACLVGVPGCR